MFFVLNVKYINRFFICLFSYPLGYHPQVERMITAPPMVGVPAPHPTLGYQVIYYTYIESYILLRLAYLDVLKIVNEI